MFSNDLRNLLECVIIGTSMMACAADTADQDFTPAAQFPLQAEAIDEPKGAYFVSVTALGTGCPANTVATEIALDGHEFTATFSAFEAEVGAERRLDLKDCQLQVRLRSPIELSLAVTDLSTQGYTYLDKGVTLKEVVSFGVSGTESAMATMTIDGPYDSEYKFEPASEQPIWSRCGSDHTMNLRTRVMLSGGAQDKSGYVSIRAAPKVRIRWRRCP